jgi:hypothetical protein
MGEKQQPLGGGSLSGMWRGDGEHRRHGDCNPKPCVHGG